MFLEPESLAELKQTLHRIPKQDRRVLVFVGRHLQERSLEMGRNFHSDSSEMAKKYHTKWEQHGAVVIRIKKEWTPTYIHYLAKKKKFSIAKLLGHIEKIPTDDEIFSYLRKNGFHEPIVNIHGTAHKRQKNPQLEINVAGSSDIPIDDINMYLDKDAHPAEVMVEYSAKGVKKRLFHENPKWLKAVLKQMDKSSLGAHYEKERVITKAEMAEIYSRYAPAINILIKNLSGKRLRKHRDKPAGGGMF